MNPFNSKNTVAKILQVYACINAIAGIIWAILLADEISGTVAFLAFSVTLVASFLIYALGEIVELLHQIKCNTQSVSPKYDTAKEAYELLCEEAEIYTFIAHNLKNVGEFGDNSNKYTMDNDFCKCFAEATHDIFHCPALTEQEAKDALAFYYNEKGLSGNMPADPLFCMQLFNRAYVEIRGYHTKAIMEKSKALLLKLKNTYNDEKYYPVLREFLEYVATGTEAFSKIDDFTTLSTWAGEYQSQYIQYQQKIGPMFVD